MLHDGKGFLIVEVNLDNVVFILVSQFQLFLKGVVCRLSLQFPAWLRPLGLLDTFANTDA
jgi:hypothetical protein